VTDQQLVGRAPTCKDRLPVDLGVVVMPIIKADLEACQGYANCVVGADDYFDIDDDGVVVVLKAIVPEADRARVEEAARSCPVSALRMENE